MSAIETDSTRGLAELISHGAIGMSTQETTRQFAQRAIVENWLKKHDQVLITREWLTELQRLATDPGSLSETLRLKAQTIRALAATLGPDGYINGGDLEDLASYVECPCLPGAPPHEHGKGGYRREETAALPPERHSPGQTGDGEGPSTPGGPNETPRAAEPRDLCHACGRPRYPEHDADAPGPTVKHPFKDATTAAVMNLQLALRDTGVKIEDIDATALREALVQISGPPWGEGRGAYLAGLLGKQFAEDKRREASS